MDTFPRVYLVSFPGGAPCFLFFHGRTFQILPVFLFFLGHRVWRKPPGVRRYVGLGLTGLVSPKFGVSISIFVINVIPVIVYFSSNPCSFLFVFIRFSVFVSSSHIFHLWPSFSCLLYFSVTHVHTFFFVKSPY